MQVNDLKKYLNAALELEKNAYTLNSAAQRNYDRIGRLGYQKNIQERTVRMEYIGMDRFLGSLIFGVIGGAILGFFIKSITIGIFVGLGIPLLIYMFRIWTKASKYNKEKRGAREYYESSIKNDDNRVSNELVLKKEMSNYLQSLEAKLTETKNTLTKFYSANIIYPKYRNMVAIASIYEYFDSGRCTTLEGHEGEHTIFSNQKYDKI